MPNLFKDLITYLVSPISIVAGVVFMVKLSNKFGKFEANFENLEGNSRKLEKKVNSLDKKFNKSIGMLSAAINKTTNAIIEIRTVLGEKFNISFNQGLGEVYGESNSPMILNSKFKKYVKDSGLDKEIDSNLTKLTKWLKTKKVETGLDAQKEIIYLVNSDKIKNYIDTKNFKSHLYKEGLTPTAYHGILTFYLFEKVIPTIIKE